MKGHIRAAVIGGCQSGKTFLTSGFSRGVWGSRRLRSIVFDPWRGETDWGPQAWVSHDFEKWKRAVCGTSGCAVVWDEATAHGGRDRENVPLFSELRHRHPVLFCIGHSHASILPVMRINLTDLYLSLADAGDADEWSRTMKDPAVMEAVKLRQFEFVHKRAFQPVRVLRHSKEEIEAGVQP